MLGKRFVNRSLWVWKSRFSCIYDNLALEDVIFNSVDFSDKDGLLIWRNRPAVVIGRHQNPFHETDLTFLRQQEITLARRRSGGGTVYHDFGNLNICCLSSKKSHDRKRNLELVLDCLQYNYGLETHVTCRHDLLLSSDNGKVSGTAAKISRDKAYHHFTLLVEADKKLMSRALTPSFEGIDCNATKSVPAKVSTLADQFYPKKIDLDNLCDDLVAEFAKNYASVHHQKLPSFDENKKLLASKHELESWNWIFGMTPKFKIRLNADSLVTVEKGIVSEIELSPTMKHKADINQFYGAKFDTDLLQKLQAILLLNSKHNK